MSEVDVVRLSRLVPAAPERVWQAWAGPELAEWYWPADLEPVVQLDPRPGGEFSLRSAPGDLAISGTVTVAEPARRLVHTWRWEGDDNESLVSVSLTPTDDGTQIDVEHMGLRSAEEVANHTAGWSSCLDRLPSHLVDAGG